MEITQAIDRLDDEVYVAPGIPLADQFRMDAAKLRARVGAIRGHADRMWGSQRDGPVGELFAALEELEALVSSAKPITGTDQVRLNRERFYDHLDRIRDAVPAAATRAGGTSPWAPVIDAVGEIERLMDDAGHSMFSRALKIDARELRHAAGRVRTTALQNVGAAPADFYAALDELDELARGEGTLKVPFRVLWDLLERMRTATMRGAAAG
jgi:hypothetical protein